MRALGTRFLVRENGGETRLTVLEHAVEAQLAQDARQTRRVEAGEQISFSAAAFSDKQPAAAEDGWLRGVLSVSQWRLDRVIAELARYRRGHLSCDPAVAGLRVSGSFPLNDTDRAPCPAQPDPAGAPAELYPLLAENRPRLNLFK